LNYKRNLCIENNFLNGINVGKLKIFFKVKETL
jgi:hypothetical protein